MTRSSQPIRSGSKNGHPRAPAAALCGVLGGLVLLAVICDQPAAAQCVGDCNNSGSVEINEVQACVNIFLGTKDPSSCPNCDRNGRNGVTIDEVQAAINSFLSDLLNCPMITPLAPTGTPTSSPSPTIPTATATASASPTLTPTPPASATHTATSTPTPTASQTFTATSSRTATPTWTRTATRTFTATPTPTPACAVQTASFGTTNGELTATDCQRPFDQILRYTDVYTITGTPGQSITVTLAATGSPNPITPFVAVIDSDGQFYRVDGTPPIQFVVTTSQAYTIMVTSDPTTTQQFGTYSMTLTSAPCATPQALTFPASKFAKLDGSECPDPAAPSIGTLLNPVDIYTFEVGTVPTVPTVPANVFISMRQYSVADTWIVPAFSILDPNGVELVTQSNNFDCTGTAANALICSQAQFLALQSGTYTIIAAGYAPIPNTSGTAQYVLQLQHPTCAAKAVTNIPADQPLTCPGQTGPGCTGTFTTNTSCSAPLPIPGISDLEPLDPSSPAALFSFTAAAGDVISVSMTDDDDSHLYLIGPAPANPLVAEDDNSNNSAVADAQLAATLPTAGTYTIIAANNTAPFDPIAYTVLIQKCPARALPTPGVTGTTVNASFTSTDCVGYGQLPFRTYSFNGTAGQFVSAAVTSSAFDAFVRIYGPDGSVVQNDNDLFAPLSSDARANRILQSTGTYFIEASASLAAGTAPPTPAAFTLQTQTCPIRAVTPGALSGAFDDSDCQLPSGKKFDVVSFVPSAVPRAASIVAPANGCVAALLAEGAQTPDTGCTNGMLELPVLKGPPPVGTPTPVGTPSTYGFMLVAADAATRGSYSAPFTLCPLAVVGFASQRTGALGANSCLTADGTRGAWFLVRNPADVVQFNVGISGHLDAKGFSAQAVLTDVLGPSGFVDTFSDDATGLYVFGTDLAGLLRVSGSAADSAGTYTLTIDPASLRQ